VCSMLEPAYDILLEIKPSGIDIPLYEEGLSVLMSNGTFVAPGLTILQVFAGKRQHRTNFADRVDFVVCI
jgi:hypothetical protein